MLPDVVTDVDPILSCPLLSVSVPGESAVVPVATAGATMFVDVKVRVPVLSLSVPAESAVVPVRTEGATTLLAKVTFDEDVEMVVPFTDSPPKPPAAV